MSLRPRLTILGSGWGAFRLLKDINTTKYAVTLVSPRNHMLITPFLPAASVGTVNPQYMCEPLRPHCAARGVRYCEAFAEHVDVEKRVVQCRTLKGEDYDVPFDRLVVAVGKRANDFGIPGVKRHAHFMKETADAMRLREAFLSNLEEASCLHARATTNNEAPLPEEEESLRQLLSIVVVGGGPASVSFAAELTDFIFTEVPRMYPQLRPYISTHLVEWATRKNNHAQDQPLRDHALACLRRKPGVQLHLGEHVDEAKWDRLRLRSGLQIPYGLLVWNAGMKPVPLVQQFSDLAKTADRSKLLTDKLMRVKGHSDIYAIGDCASIEGQSFPQTGQVADQQAAFLAQALNSDDAKTVAGTGFELRGFTAILRRFVDVPMANTTFGQKIQGRLAWWNWNAASWSSQLSVRNRLALMAGYCSAPFFGRSLTRFGQDTGALPAAPALKAAKTAGEPGAPVLDEQFVALLNDIGMQQIPQMTRMAEIADVGSNGVRPREEQQRRETSLQ